MTDNHEIGWCEEHLSVSLKEPGDEDGFDCQAAHLLNALYPCRIIQAEVLVNVGN